MKAITLFGIRIPITREKQTPAAKGEMPATGEKQATTAKREKLSLIGAEVRVKGKRPITGTVTSTSWGGLRVTIASDSKPPAKTAYGIKPTAGGRRQPMFTTVWRWRVEAVTK